MNKLQARFRQVKPAIGAMRSLELETDRLLVAQAIAMTRVSYFTPEERQRLSALVVRVTGYRVDGGI